MRMVFFLKKRDRIENLNKLLAASFANVKRDTTMIFQWLDYLYKRNIDQNKTIMELQESLSNIPRTKEQIKQIIDEIYAFEDISKSIEELNKKVSQLTERVPAETTLGLSNIQKRLEKLEEKKLSLKEKLVKKITKSSKEYVKSIILSYIKKYEKISALQLKEMIVDEQALCSKSSFYRLLGEIEELNEIAVVKKGKEKHYISKLVKKI